MGPHFDVSGPRGVQLSSQYGSSGRQHVGTYGGCRLFPTGSTRLSLAVVSRLAGPPCVPNSSRELSSSTATPGDVRVAVCRAVAAWAVWRCGRVCEVPDLQ